jgi:DNA transformation protein and related proteins
MANTAEFMTHVLDLLALAGPVEARRMFGGHGLYVGTAMFGLVDADELFLKTDAETRARFVDAGCKPWVYTRRDGTAERTSYFQPPDVAHEDPEAMLPWARLGIDAAQRAKAEKDAQARAKAARAKVRAKLPEKRRKTSRATGRRSARPAR